MSDLIVITGATGALGWALASHLALDGQAVVGLGRSARAVPEGVRFIAADLSEAKSAAAAFAAIGDGASIAGLVNAAGGFAFEKVADGSLDTWEEMHRINLLTAVNACQAAIPYLKRGASIVNVGTMSALQGGIGTAAYSAAKSGVHRLTESLAAELKPMGIRVNAVLPAIIDTEQNRRSMPDADRNEWVAPDALAKVIEFFLSPASAPVTGALLPVAGMPRG
jgi:3-oxoacyl-[acyl-carrier protein] reductase